MHLYLIDMHICTGVVDRFEDLSQNIFILMQNWLQEEDLSKISIHRPRHNLAPQDYFVQKSIVYLSDLFTFITQILVRPI